MNKRLIIYSTFIVLLLPVMFQGPHDDLTLRHYITRCAVPLTLVAVFWINYQWLAPRIFKDGVGDMRCYVATNAVVVLISCIALGDFLRAATKAHAKTQVPLVSTREVDTYPLREKVGGSDAFIYVKSDYKFLRIFLADILYVEGVKDYVKIHLRPEAQSGNMKSVLCLINMKTLEDTLPAPQFLRIHRSYIVHMPMADAIERQRIIFGQNYLPISDSYKDAVQQYIDYHTL